MSLRAHHNQLLYRAQHRNRIFWGYQATTSWPLVKPRMLESGCWLAGGPAPRQVAGVTNDWCVYPGRDTGGRSRCAGLAATISGKSDKPRGAADRSRTALGSFSQPSPTTPPVQAKINPGNYGSIRPPEPPSRICSEQHICWTKVGVGGGP